ncbi:hypothetical protein IWX90DRAFT_482448 [Phyllosticta citrichinensis]|uniref:Uncharacterized protein n=1 Tax=Phyllosticta citrichinensis TaxID=1130410 RepID=A0ABR1Y6C6_9PEZI
MPPWENQNRKAQNIAALKQCSDSVSSSAASMRGEYANFLERLNGRSKDSSAGGTANANDVGEAMGRFFRAVDVLTGNITAHTIAFEMASKSVSTPAAASSQGSSGLPRTRAALPPAAPSPPAAGALPKPRRVRLPSAQVSSAPVIKEEAADVGIEPKPRDQDPSVAEPKPLPMLPAMLPRRKRVASSRTSQSNASSVASAEYTMNEDSEPKIGSTVSISRSEANLRDVCKRSSELHSRTCRSLREDKGKLQQETDRLKKELENANRPAVWHDTEDFVRIEKLKDEHFNDLLRAEKENEVRKTELAAAEKCQAEVKTAAEFLVSAVRVNGKAPHHVNVLADRLDEVVTHPPGVEALYERMSTGSVNSKSKAPGSNADPASPADDENNKAEVGTEEQVAAEVNYMVLLGKRLAAAERNNQNLSDTVDALQMHATNRENENKQMDGALKTMAAKIHEPETQTGIVRIFGHVGGLSTQ